ncbi:hypothetical protein GTO89_16000 [Heliobacterium gestii]|uniref:Uncharacterized protein n=1 Tax=Heliomicrobium gestii TaxID=2699 RepID=A0A845LJH1_HELGE|nr:hypothetical protein [Heliomicrobium gestii]MBM7868411.1 hypothetical protein [Heliomicrobium gestii]MZP44535.1 hypothetical protein [Heliomicrobium gestii]
MKVRIKLFTALFTLLYCLTMFTPYVLASESSKSNPIQAVKAAQLTLIEKATGNKSNINIGISNNIKEPKKLIEDKLKNTKYKLDEIKYIDGNNTTQESQQVGITSFETLFDVGCLVLSLNAYYEDPSFWNGFWVVMDTASVIFPGVPSISGVRTMMENSSKLKTSLSYSIKKYGQFSGSLPRGTQAHHIIEQRFAKNFSTTVYSMLAIALKDTDHSLMTYQMRQKIPYGTDYSNLQQNYLVAKHIEAYTELYDQTADDIWRFLAKFTESQWLSS